MLVAISVYQMEVVVWTVRTTVSVVDSEAVHVIVDYWEAEGFEVQVVPLEVWIGLTEVNVRHETEHPTLSMLALDENVVVRAVRMVLIAVRHYLIERTK